MTSNNLIPTIGCWVKKKNSDEPGIVKGHNSMGETIECQILWIRSRKSESISPSDLCCGFPLGILVQDIPSSRTRKTLGEGVVVETRKIGFRDQVLVEFPERGDRFWLPYENLKQIKGIHQRFELGQTGENDNAERFRLRNLAYAIELWHENTGGLSQLDIDPLPHQIHLVHRILGSGNLNWLIADDVGLGKTIEVGMLLSALTKKGTHRRILLVTPAGLVNQWKEELHSKFGLGEFRSYGDDFNINDSRHWRLHNHVIASIDRLKAENHLANILQADPWDIVVFDEAHRLSRAQYGMQFEASDRFRLAAALRRHTDSILLLTATPHQGKQDKFQALLEIIRPELKTQIRTLDLNPGILRDMVIRNRKSDVTDAEGNFIFLGKTTFQTPVKLNEQELGFDKALRRYLREGYQAMAADGSITGRAIGFVMATYRKLAASSIAAIERSLRRRLCVLEAEANENLVENDLSYYDERYLGEWEENIDYSDAPQFFDGEIVLLKELIGQAQDIFEVDSKIKNLIDVIITDILKNNSDEKILIFSEYRGTQGYIVEALRNKFGYDSVSLLNGGMKQSEREQHIAHFEDNGRFLVSTEAGGEGINLQRECHIMINYDLPWNPMRIVQRVGRLYRYGQTKRVVIFNMQVPDSMDGNILDILYRRIDSVINDMATIGGEFRPGLEAEILGEFVDVLDVEDILQQADKDSIDRSRESIEEALVRAREAAELQRDLLEYVASYNPDGLSGELKINLDHVDAFVLSVMEFLEIETLETTHKGKVRRIKLPQELVAELGMGGRQLQVTLDREIAGRRSDIQMLDLNSPLLNYMLNYVKEYKFDGRVANVTGSDGHALITAILRWQNDQGLRMRQEYGAFVINQNGETAQNPDEFSDWLKEPAAKNGHNKSDRERRKLLYSAGEKAINYRLAEVSNMSLHPENMQIITGGLV